MKCIAYIKALRVHTHTHYILYLPIGQHHLCMHWWGRYMHVHIRVYVCVPIHTHTHIYRLKLDVCWLCIKYIIISIEDMYVRPYENLKVYNYAYMHDQVADMWLVSILILEVINFRYLENKYGMVLKVRCGVYKLPT
mgnify:CR=1 FL=1